MCGIFSMTAKADVIDEVLAGLKKLEYRGYDSAGIAFLGKNSIKTLKRKGRIHNLEQALKNSLASSNCAISHTRWATHGKPSDKNSHPHKSRSGRFSLVHNGIIENFIELKEDYLKDITLKSETDTEVIVQLIDVLFEQDTLFTLHKVCNLIRGSYAFCLLNKDEPETIYVAKKDSPLVVGKTKDACLIASDVSAILNYTNEQFILQNHQFVVAKPSAVQFFDKDLNPINPSPTKITESTTETSLGEFEHFMKKEIHEVPEAILQTIGSYKQIQDIFKKIPKQKLKKVRHIKLIACGTAYHAALVGKKVLQTLLPNIITEALIASEFRYSHPKLFKDTLCIFVSQSGETADTIAALKLCKTLGATTLTITNVKNSSITYEADYNLFTHAGREVAVASTKAYNSQLAMLYLFAHALLEVQISTAKGSYQSCYKHIEKIFENKTLIHYFDKIITPIAKEFYKSKNIYLIGRQLDYLTALEAALKIKEISYIASEAYPAGELKHGTISLIEQGTLVICFLTQSEVSDKTQNALHEVKSRGARVVLLTQYKSMSVNTDIYDELIVLPEEPEFFMPIISVIPMQLLAYHFSKNLELNPDRPRNLAKAVTVE